MSVFEIFGAVLMLAGTVLSVLAAWGVVDFPSSLARMHAATKSASLGLALIAVGAGIAAESWGLLGVGFLVALFLFMTAPISGHMLGRAAYLTGQVRNLVHDDLLAGNPTPLDFSRRPSDARFSVLRAGLLVGVWLLLWRDLSPGVWLGGAVVAGIVEAMRRVFLRPGQINPVGLAIFLVRYLGMVVVSNIRVAWEVITPSNEQIREAIVAVPLRTTSVSAALLVANAISYTPGSLTIELTDDPLVLYVHVLFFTSVADVQADVRELEGLAMRALPDAVEV
jgi:monovalent cation/proton antiporter MnhG/PhaG subunit